MVTALVVLFVIGYLAIALEHILRVNKAASALLTGVGAWTVLVGARALWPQAPAEFAHAGADAGRAFLIESQLLELTGETAGLLFFLLGAMTIVELVDYNNGFTLITRHVTSGSGKRLLWMVAWITFFMSSVLDNLTTTIVMISILRKVVPAKAWRLWFVGLVVIAANAGGAWTPIGDVTTTMLWMHEKFTPPEVIVGVVAPSIVCLLVPLLILTAIVPSELPLGEGESGGAGHVAPDTSPRRQLLFLALGLTGLLSVPLFKVWTHLPPFLGMLLSLAVMWVVSDAVHWRHPEGHGEQGVVAVLRRIDLSSILFFLGILLAVGALGEAGLLMGLARWLDGALGDRTVIAVAIGLVSAVVDNVPLVAAGIDMYALPTGDGFWLLLAYCAGTGGSCLIIGSAAGVAAMGLESIDFVWYLRRIAPLALLGYLAGALALALV